MYNFDVYLLNNIFWRNININYVYLILYCVYFINGIK